MTRGVNFTSRRRSWSRLCEPLSPMAFNDLYCLARPQVHTLSIGAARPSDFDEHIGALEYYDEAEAVSGPIAARLRAEMDAVLGADWRENWTRGIPEYTETPGQINLLEILRLWAFAKGLDMVEFGKNAVIICLAMRALVPREKCGAMGSCGCGACCQPEPFRGAYSCDPG